jgi:putative DNA primase/helicase
MTPQLYISHNFKALRCKGYNTKYNPDKNYKTAKEALDKGFTKDNFPGLSLQEIEDWEKTNGWIGWLIPKGYIVLDSEEQDDIEYIKTLCKQLNIIPPEHNTNKGKHFFFVLIKNFSGASEVFTKSGLKLTYRIGGRNYLILAPTNGRTWEIPL